MQAGFAVGCANGTDALYMALLALDIQPGDEVITTPFTYIATAEAISQVGATPVFADIEPDSYNIDPKSVAAKVTDKTKAIIIVHLYGQCCDMNSIMDIAEKHSLKVIEDSAQAFGATCEFRGETKFAGTIGDIGTFSFYPTKNLSCAGDGGLLTTNSQATAERLKKIRVHGTYERYYHDEMGVNSRLDEMQAAILLVKLKYIAAWNDHRAKIAEIYNEAFKDIDGLITPSLMPGAKHIYHQYTLRLDQDVLGDAINRDQLMDKLKEAGIASAVYYPLPLHMQKLYQPLGYKPEDLPHSLKASKEIICLPVFAELSLEDAKLVADSVKSLIPQTSKV